MFGQCFIDFCEDRMFTTQNIGERRARKYGDKSWPWKIAILQEIFWSKLSSWFLYH